MKTYISKNKRSVFTYSKAIILPRKETPIGPRWGLGGVCDVNNHFVEVSFYDGGWATQGGYYEWSEEEYFNEDVVYMGLFFSHWGHFLIDLTGRMWYLQKLAKTSKEFKVAYIGEEEPKGNNLLFLKLLGINEEQLFRISKPTRFRNVLVPEQSFKPCEWYTEEFINMFDEMVSMVLQDKDKFVHLQGIDKIYFTRKKFSKAMVSEFGETYFESLFVQNGYVAIAPEELSLEEQIFLWNNASIIACINGTIPLNVLFSKKSDVELIILNKTSIFHENPMILLEMRRISACFINIYKEPLEYYPKSLGEGPYLLWPSKQFDDFCNKQKYISQISRKKRKYYFIFQQIKYYWAIVGVKNRLRNVTSIMPKKMKEFIKKYLLRRYII